MILSVKFLREEYFSTPTDEDMERIFAENEARGFLGLLGSLDCCHQKWKNFPSAWAGQYSGETKVLAVVLKAVATKNLCVQHVFFGMPGFNNDINVMKQSPILFDIADGRYPNVEFTAND